MKGVILAGGTGSRLHPLTKVTNKHLLPVGDKPMIYHSVEKLIEAGITDILIITGLEHMGDIVQTLGSGKDFECELTYRVQDEAGGIAQALYLAKDFVGKDNVCVILGDNIFEDSLATSVELFERHANCEASFCGKIFLKEVLEPERFGVANFDGHRVTSIDEKPKNPKSQYAVAGIYFYDHYVFDIIEVLTPSARGEYEITDVNNVYITDGIMTYDILEGFWTDAGTPKSYWRANQLVMEKNK